MTSTPSIPPPKWWHDRLDATDSDEWEVGLVLHDEARLFYQWMGPHGGWVARPLLKETLDLTTGIVTVPAGKKFTDIVMPYAFPTGCRFVYAEDHVNYRRFLNGRGERRLAWFDGYGWQEAWLPVPADDEVYVW